MPNTYDLTQLDPNTFENMVNFLAIKNLGKGSTGFAPGADGGRDGYFEGEAPYPSEKTRWSGVWYIQSKFHKPHLSTNPQKWLLNQVTDEIKDYKGSTGRKLPDIWIIATNIEPSGTPETGAFDKISKLVANELGPQIKFDIWGGRKILDFLAADPSVASYYGHFLTPGQVLTSLYNQIADSSSQVKSIVEHLVIGQFNEQIYTKLEQAGSSADTRPKLHELFVDLPFYSNITDQTADILATLVASSANVHKVSAWNLDKDRWRTWSNVPKRARVIILKGGPGQGKSTAGQYFAQIQRAALILSEGGPIVPFKTRNTAEQFRLSAILNGFWSDTPRIPITIELKDFAAWFGSKSGDAPKGVLSYISDKIRQKTEQTVETGTLKRAFSTRSWFVNFDGLDEVPNDVKDKVANEIIKFTDETMALLDADILTLCTTRPQGYSGQFDRLDASVAVLSDLPRHVALACATAVVQFERTASEAANYVSVLESAMESKQVLELMTTPLQSHIMAVVVRDGGRPPEKRWELFDNFYKVMKKRESQKNFQDQRIAKLLREGDTLLKAIHTRLGIVLHALSEVSKGAETTLNKSEFMKLARTTTVMLIDENVDDVVDALMEATIERLVFVNTPESSNTVRFDIRQLQEFFAGEFIYSDVSQDEFCARLDLICSDAHWREVMHFTLSALIVNGRNTELSLASQILINVDGRGECHRSKLFNKRMAIGALLGIRLLNEGVLEQDKRVRQHFLNVVTPLYAALDEKSLDLLTSNKHINSRAWLHNAMIEQLFQGNETESIGAAIALIRTLPGDHPRALDVSCKIFSSSNSFLEMIFSVQAKGLRNRRGRIHGEVTHTQKWFIVGTLSLLLESTPRANFDYSSAIKVLRNNALQLFSTPEFLALSASVTKLLFLLLDIDRGSHILPKERNRAIYKGLNLEELSYTWRSEKIPDFFDTAFSNTEVYSPMLAVIYGIYKFTTDKTPYNLQELIELARPFKQFSKLLPSHLNALIPLDTWGSNEEQQFSALTKLSEASFSRFLKFGKINGKTIIPTVESIGIEGAFTTQSWKNICRDLPNLALDVWMQGLDLGNNHDDPFFVKCVEEAAFKNSQRMGNYVLQWQNLFALLPDQGSRLYAHLQSVPLTVESDYFIQEDIRPFRMSLESTLILLPTIAAALVYRQYYGDRPKEVFFLRRASQHNQAILDEFSLTEPLLSSIYINVSNSLDTRRAALAAYLSQDFEVEASYPESQFRDKIYYVAIELLDKAAPDWFVASIFIFAESYLRHDDSLAITLIGHCFDTYRDNYLIRMMMHSLVANWRERSSAPVQSSKILNTWLETPN
jgi:hypothetical protein